MPDAATSPLARAVAEIERHVAGDGWDQAPRLFALAPTADLLSREPALVDRLRGGGQEPSAEQLTPIEQELPNQHLEDPPAAENGMPAAPGEAAAWAARHPDRADVRIVVAVLRDGARWSVLRVRGHDDSDLLRETDLAPDLADALAATFAD